MVDIPEILPWFSPGLSQGISRVILNIGSRGVLNKGQIVGTNAFFKRTMFVKSGFVAQGLINPGGTSPFMLTLSGPGSFGISTDAIDRLDHLPRRYWAATHCEVYTVNPELLLRLAEVEASWNRELNEYALRRAVSERLGLMMCQATGVEERLGVFFASLFASFSRSAVKEMEKGGDWLELPTPPSRKLVSAVLSCRSEEVDETLSRWWREKMIVFSNGRLLMRGSTLLRYWNMLQPFMQMQSEYVRGYQPREEFEFEL